MEEKGRFVSSWKNKIRKVSRDSGNPYVSSRKKPVPVSYTHLDVYKRQVVGHPSKRWIASSKLIDCLRPKQTIVGLILAADDDDEEKICKSCFLESSTMSNTIVSRIQISRNTV